MVSGPLLKPWPLPAEAELATCPFSNGEHVSSQCKPFLVPRTMEKQLPAAIPC
jgi:hypothetical protein